MCILAITIWSLTLAKEVRDTARLMRALLHLPTTYGPSIISIDAEQVDVKMLHPDRVLAVLAVQLLRLVIAGLVYVSGGLFIVRHTISIEDLILNALALEFILGFDEVLLSSMAPPRLIQMMRQITPLPKPHVKLWRGLDLYSVFRFVAALITVIIWGLAVLKPTVSIVTDTRDSICGGELDWVYSLGSVGQTVWAQTSPDANLEGIGRTRVRATSAAGPWKPRWALDSAAKIDLRLDAVLRGAGEGDSQTCVCREGLTQILPIPQCCLAQQIHVPVSRGGVFAVQSISTQSLDQGLQMWNPLCQDMLDFSNNFPLKDLITERLDGLLRSASPCPHCPLADHTFCLNNTCGVPASCDALEAFCDGESVLSVTTRHFCPQRCGCTDPRSALVHSNAPDGCGSYCVKRPEYYDALSQVPCIDLAPDSAVFAAFLDATEAATLRWPANWASGYNRVILGLIRQLGCPFVSQLAVQTGLNLCIEGGSQFPMKPFSYFCPISCGCRGGTDADPHCPIQCPVDGAVHLNSTYAALNAAGRLYIQGVQQLFPSGWVPPFFDDRGTGEVHLWL